MIVSDFTEWLINGWPPWTVYCAMTSSLLIALDKQTGIRPVGVGETWRWMIVK